MDLQAEWQQLCSELGADEGWETAVFHLFTTYYNETHRHYHTLAHVEAMLSQSTHHLDGVAPDEVLAFKLAVWFHDLIYDVTPNAQNEHRSAVLAGDWLQKLVVDPRIIERVQALIELTASHPPQPDDFLAQLLLDLDLGVLGAKPATYDAYAQAIRQEYSMYPDELYQMGRMQVLQTFLQRPQLFPLLVSLEAPARDNLNRELASLV